MGTFQARQSAVTGWLTATAILLTFGLAFQSPALLAHPNQLYVEDNTFTGAGINQIYFTDDHRGFRSTYRFNTLSQYNGTFPGTFASDTTFTYTVSGSPAMPATGTITTPHRSMATRIPPAIAALIRLAPERATYSSRDTGHRSALLTIRSMSIRNSSRSTPGTTYSTARTRPRFRRKPELWWRTGISTPSGISNIPIRTR